MGYRLSKADGDTLLAWWSKEGELLAPVRMEGEGCFSDTDVVRYGSVSSVEEIEWEKKSDYSFKEALLPVNETLFYFTEDETMVPKEREKTKVILLRACDLHALKRLDQIYLHNGGEDYYYKRLRKKAKFVLMPCAHTCDSGFCVTMGTNECEDYDAYMSLEGGEVLVEIRDEDMRLWGKEILEKQSETSVIPAFPKENKEKVTLPKHLSNESFSLALWKEYGDRCIGCGRCNFVCPTCTCFTMQDIFYRDNGNVGERRRVWASCQVDGYTDMAGGHSCRKSQGERMRFKVMHKIYDFEKRFGYPMCVGCGRCEDVCPEYISYSNCINRLAKEEQAHEK